MKKEKVLCFKRKDLPASWTAKRCHVPMDETDFFHTVSNTEIFFKDRDAVENDPAYKQIIPYIVLQSDDFAYTAVYRRKGSEKRLHDLWSIGIGGHVNPEDRTGENPGLAEILYAAMTRELDEELARRPENDTPRFLGTVNDEETSVGSVHMGAVFRILTAAMDRYIPGDELASFHFSATRKAEKLSLEGWSALAFRLISEARAAR